MIQFLNKFSSIKKGGLEKLFSFSPQAGGSLFAGARASRERGFGIVEIVVAVSIISIAFFTISQMSVIYLKQTIQNKQSLKAAYLTEEALEAVRSVRDQGWVANIQALTMESNYYPVISGNKWILTSSNPGLLEGVYTRQIIVNNVSRDASDNIVSSGGTNDPDTKKITATISWDGKSTTLTTYLTNLYNN